LEVLAGSLHAAPFTIVRASKEIENIGFQMEDGASTVDAALTAKLDEWAILNHLCENTIKSLIT
jgi:hypothetical protein